MRNFAALILLLTCPITALFKLSSHLNWAIVSGYLTLISLTTYCLYWADKRKAQNGHWRIPESTLHFAELAGGWPAAFLAQRHFRHKIAKNAFQQIFWLIVIAHQYFALDCLLDWRIAQIFLQFLR